MNSWDGEERGAWIDVALQARPEATQQPDKLRVELAPEDTRLERVVSFVLRQLLGLGTEGLSRLPDSRAPVEAIVVLVHDGDRIVGSRCYHADGAEGHRPLVEFPARHGRAMLLAVLLDQVDLKVLMLWHLAHPDEAFALSRRQEWRCGLLVHLPAVRVHDESTMKLPLSTQPRLSGPSPKTIRKKSMTTSLPGLPGP